MSTAANTTPPDDPANPEEFSSTNRKTLEAISKLELKSSDSQRHESLQAIVQNQAGMHKKQPEIVQSELEQEIRAIMADLFACGRSYGAKPLSAEEWQGQVDFGVKRAEALITQREAQAYERGRRDALERVIAVSPGNVVTDITLRIVKSHLDEKGKPDGE